MELESEVGRNGKIGYEKGVQIFIIRMEGRGDLTEVMASAVLPDNEGLPQHPTKRCWAQVERLAVPLSNSVIASLWESAMCLQP